MVQWTLLRLDCNRLLQPNISRRTTYQNTMTPPTVFVTSATGAQGLALVRHLHALPTHWSIRATTRSLLSPSATLLSQLGVSLTPGSWDDTDALGEGLTSCTHLFLNTSPPFPPSPHEITQALTILRLAKAAGVRNVVYTSALAVNRLDELPSHLLSETSTSFLRTILTNKAAIEEAVRTSGFETWTILRPASFMENFVEPKVGMYPGLVETGVWKMALLEGKKMPLVDTDGIARFATRAWEGAGEFGGREIEIAGDELDPGEIMAVLSSVAGRELRWEGVSEEEVEERRRRGDPMMQAQLAMRELGKFVRVEEVRKWGVALNTFGEFLERNGEVVRRTYGREGN